MKLRQVGFEVLHVERRTDRLTDGRTDIWRT